MDRDVWWMCLGAGVDEVVKESFHGQYRQSNTIYTARSLVCILTEVYRLEYYRY